MAIDYDWTARCSLLRKYVQVLLPVAKCGKRVWRAGQMIGPTLNIEARGAYICEGVEPATVALDPRLPCTLPNMHARWERYSLLNRFNGSGQPQQCLVVPTYWVLA